MQKRQIIQLVGQPGSGKSSVAKHLADVYGFSVIRVSDLIKAYATEKQIPLLSREDYTLAHRRLLQERGEFIVTEEILGNIGNVCVDGMRVPAHIEKLKQHGSVVIGLNCPPEMRFERVLKRARSLDKKTLSAFIEDEFIEANHENQFDPNTEKALSVATITIDTTQPFSKVTASIDEIISGIID